MYRSSTKTSKKTVAHGLGAFFRLKYMLLKPLLMRTKNGSIEGRFFHISILFTCFMPEQHAGPCRSEDTGCTPKPFWGFR